MDIIEIKELLKIHYNLSGDLQLIYSELDAVYALVTPTGEKYVIKISNPDRSKQILELESSALAFLGSHSFPYDLQEIIRTIEGHEIVKHNTSHVRVLTWIDATLLADCFPHTTDTRISIGRMLGVLSKALKSFNHDAAKRFIKWDPSQLLWIKDYIHLLPAFWQNKFILQIKKFGSITIPLLDECPKQINYNDANDYNILCKWNETQKLFEASGLIDFLDMVYTHRINELAIGCAYSILKLSDPLKAAAELVYGYHKVNPLLDRELLVLYDMILARLMISVTVSAINKAKNPENEYLQVTETDAWSLIGKWVAIHPSFVYYTLRSACGEIPVPYAPAFNQWARIQSFAPIVSKELLISPHRIDLSVGSKEIGHFSNYLIDRLFNRHIEEIFEDTSCSIAIGSYHEIRPVYTTEQFKKEGNDGPEWRTLHLGLDLFAPAGTPVFASYPGIIYSLKNNNSSRDYGPTIIIKHIGPEMEWFSLYGHLSKDSLELLQVGDHIVQGQTIGSIGQETENGGWPPHVHFQIILDLLNYSGDFPGVANYNEREVWLTICPDPELITGIKSIPAEEKTTHDLVNTRKKILGSNLSISYKKQLWIKRGLQQYLIDHTGRRYLDTVNNVAHCGHEHPRIVSTGIKAMSVLNTNTRYLHEHILELADSLIRRVNPALNVCFFTNSGTEANELAVRMAKAYTGSTDFLTMQWGYHGNSNAMVDLSSYKFDRKGGKGRPDHTHVIPMPDPFRGKYSDKPDQSNWYLKEIQKILTIIEDGNSKPAGLLAESILSCGGQIIYPDTFMQEAIQMVRKAGGIYIADEVQTGLGRIGSYFSAYELYGVIPDIITLGKPLGNGHPVGAVICTPEIAQAFNNGMEYFNTFGGNPVSCSIALEVLKVIDDEGMISHASKIGTYLLNELNSLKNEFSVIADVRGYGFFLGIELMKNGLPATSASNYLTGRMREHGILMSTDGPDDNVIKIKPPMCFDMNNADEVLDRMRKILHEYPLQ